MLLEGRGVETMTFKEGKHIRGVMGGQDDGRVKVKIAKRKISQYEDIQLTQVLVMNILDSLLRQVVSPCQYQKPFVLENLRLELSHRTKTCSPLNGLQRCHQLLVLQEGIALFGQVVIDLEEQCLILRDATLELG